MIDSKLHIFFHSNLDDPNLWCHALSDMPGPIHFSVDGFCERPATVDIALLWTTPIQ
ncbi:hypothetical protein SAMN03159391_03424 [Pseudomonas sp. NFACC37-1]|nr:hypothetical protein SAMN03159391_03424 [Pseudomonas sp. NFACC37-1]SFO48621.1 hypothetical protein SAMN03159304_03578 [Pseudomonas sp. NFACC24-1]